MSETMKLWYRQPAAAWEETLPIGNGMPLSSGSPCPSCMETNL